MPNLENYIHNALHTATARLRIGPSTSISEIALAHRKAVEVALDPNDIEVGMAVVREMGRRRQASHTCEPGDRSYSVSNWCAAWKDLDFSTAVKGATTSGVKPKVTVLGQSGERGVPQRCKLILCHTHMI